MSVAQTLKRTLIGRTMASGELPHTLFPKVLALPVFSSDPLSSNAYATQEILLVLGLVGASALDLVIPIAFAVAILLGNRGRVVPPNGESLPERRRSLHSGT
jgi:hypothetical protein